MKICVFFSENSCKRYEGAEVKHEIYFERPKFKDVLYSMFGPHLLGLTVAI